jgi:hypothetical protein
MRRELAGKALTRDAGVGLSNRDQDSGGTEYAGNNESAAEPRGQTTDAECIDASSREFERQSAMSWCSARS